MENLNAILEIIDDNKENISSGDYLKICNNLNNLNKNQDNFFKCLFIYPYIKKDNIHKSLLFYKKKISIVKLTLEEYETINSLILYNDCVISNNTYNMSINKLYNQLLFYNKYEYITQFCNSEEMYNGIHKIKFHPIILELTIF